MKNFCDRVSLHNLLHYDARTGVFSWVVRTSNRVNVGDVAGFISLGYRRIRLQGRVYMAHRLAWFWMTGVWPVFQIDHRNGNKIDNRWSNLREADGYLNSQNLRKSHSDSQTGLLGAHPYRGRFQAQITVGGKQIHLGYFSKPEKAHAVYLKVKREFHPSCTI
jgi:hypothetical protein